MGGVVAGGTGDAAARMRAGSRQPQAVDGGAIVGKAGERAKHKHLIECHVDVHQMAA